MPSITERERHVLAKIYASQFVRNTSRLDYLTTELATNKQDLTKEISKLRKKKLVQDSARGPHLSKLGRDKIVVVMAGGSFDIIHPGHLETLGKARNLGDVLLVSVARDATFRKNKNRQPLHNEQMRAKLVSSLKMVDTAVLGSENQILDTAVVVNPDIIAIGYDQIHNLNWIASELRDRGVKVKVVRLKSSMPRLKTSLILSTKKSITGT